MLYIIKAWVEDGPSEYLVLSAGSEAAAMKLAHEIVPAGWGIAFVDLNDTHRGVAALVDVGVLDWEPVVKGALSSVSEDDPDYFTFDKQTTKLLRYYYDRAVAEGKEEFTFSGRVLVTDYARYLLEYLEPKLGLVVLPRDSSQAKSSEQ